MLYMGPIMIKCAGCGCEMRRRRNGEIKKYCSNDCYLRFVSKNYGEEIECGGCGKMISRYVHKHGKGWYERKCCDFRCGKLLCKKRRKLRERCRVCGEEILTKGKQIHRQCRKKKSYLKTCRKCGCEFYSRRKYLRCRSCREERVKEQRRLHRWTQNRKKCLKCGAKKKRQGSYCSKCFKESNKEIKLRAKIFRRIKVLLLDDDYINNIVAKQYGMNKLPREILDIERLYRQFKRMKKVV